MKRITAMILACMTISLIVPLARPGSALARGGNVLLESLSPLTSKTSQLLTADNPGHFSKAPLTHGLRFGDKDAYAEYALGGRYATLSGTLYSDDMNSSTTATILFVDASGRDPKVLLRIDVPQQARKAFRLSVRGVSRLMVEQVKCCGIDVDVLAALTPSPRVPIPPLKGEALETVTQDTGKTSQLLTLDSPGHFSGLLLARGIQLGDKDAYAEYALGGRYATLSGTLYSDDMNSSTTATILFVDASGRDPKVLLRTDVSSRTRKAFRLSVRGVGHLLVQQVKCCGIDVDVLATLTPGPRIPTPSFRGTALESQTLDTSQGSQPLTLDSPGHVSGALVTNGFQLGDNASAVYALNRRYATLSGTLYSDDASSSNTATVIVANAGTSKVLLRVDVPLGARKAFRVSLQGVSRLEVEQSKCCGLYVDVVAALTR